MAKYKIWNKTDTLYTPSGKAYTGEEYIKNYARWAENPSAKVIISAGAINCGIFMDFEAVVTQYKKAGAAITDSMTDAEILTAIESFDDRASVVDTIPSTDERIAAALEYQVMASMPDAVV